MPSSGATTVSDEPDLAGCEPDAYGATGHRGAADSVDTVPRSAALTGNLLEYAVPTAGMLPNWELDLVATPSPNNPLGAKGIGESGCVAAPPAIVNAVLDALAPLGFDPLTMQLDMPLTSEKVWRADPNP